MKTVMSWLKTWGCEATTWAGLAVLATAGGKYFADGDPGGAQELALSGLFLILLRGRAIPGITSKKAG